MPTLLLGTAVPLGGQLFKQPVTAKVHSLRLLRKINIVHRESFNFSFFGVDAVR